LYGVPALPYLALVDGDPALAVRDGLVAVLAGPGDRLCCFAHGVLLSGWACGGGASPIWSQWRAAVHAVVQAVRRRVSAVRRQGVSGTLTAARIPCIESCPVPVPGSRVCVGNREPSMPAGPDTP